MVTVALLIAKKRFHQIRVDDRSNTEKKISVFKQKRTKKGCCLKRQSHRPGPESVEGPIAKLATLVERYWQDLLIKIL